jgi:hypothetical protein
VCKHILSFTTQIVVLSNKKQMSLNRCSPLKNERAFFMPLQSHTAIGLDLIWPQPLSFNCILKGHTIMFGVLKSTIVLNFYPVCASETPSSSNPGEGEALPPSGPTRLGCSKACLRFLNSLLQLWGPCEVDMTTVTLAS